MMDLLYYFIRDLVGGSNGLLVLFVSSYLKNLWICYDIILFVIWLVGVMGL